MMDLKTPRDRRVLFAVAGGALALIAGAAIGVSLMGRGGPAPVTPAEAPGTVRVEMGKEDPGLDPERPLRCFANGQFVGMLTLNDCARRNGVATGSLDVGLDPSGEVAAATGDAEVLQPLPSAPEPPGGVVEERAPPAEEPEVEAPAATAAAGPTAACWRFTGEWRKVAEDMSLDACVQVLFAGRCERPGAASYGRWGSDTLRLVTGRVERSSNNRTFRTLVRQSPGGCSIPHL